MKVVKNSSRILIKKRFESFICTGLKIPSDYKHQKEDNEHEDKE